MRYVVKIRRFYEGREATSVLTQPMPREDALIALKMLQEAYQSDQYYMEKWVETDYDGER